MASIVVAGDTSGTVTLTAPATAGTTTLTLPTANGTLLTTATSFSNGQGPAFWCSPGADTTISSATDVVIANSSETYDTASCFNNTGSTVGGIPAYAFLPNVAGFYLFTSTINTELSTGPTRFINSVRFNGSTAYRVVDTSVAYAPAVSSGSILLFMNGTTDYVQQVIYLAASTPRYSSSITTARFSGFLVRAA